MEKVKLNLKYLYISVLLVIMLAVGFLLAGCNTDTYNVSPSEKELKMGTYVFDKAVDADSKENYSYFVAVTFEDNNFLSFVAYFNESTIGMPNNVYTFEDIPYVRDGDTIEVSITSPIEVKITATIIDDYKISFSEPFRESRTCYLSYQEDFKFEEERYYHIFAEFAEILGNNSASKKDEFVRFDNGVIYKLVSTEEYVFGTYSLYGNCIVINIESYNCIIFGKIFVSDTFALIGEIISDDFDFPLPYDIIVCFE